MTDFTTTYTVILRQWRAGRRWCYANAASLLVVLMLGFGEPALCVLHCSVWVPFMQMAQMPAHQHLMVMPDGSTMMMDSADMASHGAGFQLPARPPSTAPTPNVSSMVNASADLLLVAPASQYILVHTMCVPTIEPLQDASIPAAQAFHELIPGRMLAVSMSLIYLHAVCLRLCAYPSRLVAPLLRPPIFTAA